jgi:hypothetical protein
LRVIESRPQDASHQPLSVRVFQLPERRVRPACNICRTSHAIPLRLQRSSYKRRSRDRKFENALIRAQAPEAVSPIFKFVEKLSELRVP